MLYVLLDFKVEHILPDFTPAKRDGKRQIWFSNLWFLGLEERNLHSKNPNLSDIAIHC